jgi:hypothetical protein
VIDSFGLVKRHDPKKLATSLRDFVSNANPNVETLIKKFLENAEIAPMSQLSDDKSFEEPEKSEEM